MTLDEIVKIATYLPASTWHRHPHTLTYMGTREYMGDIYNIYRNDDLEKEDPNEVTYSQRYYIISHWSIEITARMEKAHIEMVNGGMIRESRVGKKYKV